MKIAFCHHLSLSYNGGGEKFIINLAKELAKKHDVEIHSLPILLDGKRKINPQQELDGIPYIESLHHKVKADISYVTYNPLSWLNFCITGKKIAGMHSEAYWKPPNLMYGKYPLLANIVNKFASYTELRRFDAIHRLTSVYPINHSRIFTIPNFVDAELYHPTKKSDEFTVAFASRHVWQKGIEVLRALEKQMGIKISDNIPEAEMPEFYSSSHVTIVPSLVDTFGLTVVESALCGTPVITTSLPCHKNLGLPLIYSDSVKEYASSIKLLRNIWETEPRKYADLSMYFRREALKYDKSEVVKRIETMLKEVVEYA